jgi:hypothetical protein
MVRILQCDVRLLRPWVLAAAKTSLNTYVDG